MKTSRFALIGAGNIGKNLLRILAEKQQFLADRYGLQLALVAAVDSGGAALNSAGLDLLECLKLKQARKSVSTLSRYGVPGLTALGALEKAGADLLVELSPTNLKDGEPGLSAITWALNHGMDVVTANKGPLVVAFQRLMALAAEKQRSLLFSATVTGGLPTVNIGRRDLVGAKVTRVEGIFNTTTNYILSRMAEAGLSLEEALKEAQAAGVAEANPTLDVDGWDAANKLIIVANSVLNMPATLQDIAVTGIRGIRREDLLRAKEKGCALKLLVTAEADGERYKLSVRPTEVPLEHPMARLTKWQMGVVYATDIMGTITAIIDDEGTSATTAAVLRDIINTLRSR